MIFYYPNRPTLRPVDPKNISTPTSWYLDELEKSGVYIAEKKFNGDNVYIDTDNPLQLWNRVKEPHHYRPTPEVLKELEMFPKGTVLNAELMHYKTVGIKNRLIIHCVMRWKGVWLIGKTWGEARILLDDFASRTYIKISPIYKSGFWDLYSSADGKEIEGIVLKDPKGKLLFSTSPIKDVPWMLKFRHPCAKYNF
jgi:hypothetical protein